jgi:hypothetical protein
MPSLSHRGIGLSVDRVIAAGVTAAVVSASDREGLGWTKEPAHARFSFVDYFLQETLHEPRIEVYPLASYEAYSEYAAQAIADLRQLLAERPAAPETIPVLPAFNAMQLIRAQVAYVDFRDGTGIRFLTQYAQAPGPINNHGLFYAFQGLTDEGHAYVAAILPVSHRSLPANLAAYEGNLYDLAEGFDAYVAEVVEQLGEQEASSFRPDLGRLDAIVQSLEVGSRCPPAAPVDREGPEGPYPGWGKVVNEDYGFAFRYPLTWTLLREEVNYATLCQGALNLTIAYRRQGEDVSLPRSGLPAGDLVDLDLMHVQGHAIARQALIYEGKVKMLLYKGPLRDLLLTAWLEDVTTLDYPAIDLSETLRDQVDQIVGSWTAAAPDHAPPAVVTERLLPGWVYRLPRGTGASGLWLVDASGRSRRVSSDPRTTLSPDGRQLITYHDASAEYQLRDRVTGDYSHLAVTPGRLECCYRWWPGRPGVLLFTSIPVDGQSASIGPDGSPVGAVSVVNENGTGYEILDAPITWSTVAAPSPDGQTLAYSEGKTGWLYRWSVGPEVFDPTERGLADLSNAQLSSPAWSPDGTKLAWVVAGRFDSAAVDAKGGAVNLRRTAVVVYNLPARTADVLLYYHQAGKGFQQPAPVWSPDGRWLAFEAWSTLADEDGVWVLPVDGSPDERTYLGPGSGPVWSPDGRWLAFTRVEGEGNQTYVNKVGGGDAIPFQRMAGAQLVDWIELAPDAQPVPTATPLPAIARNDILLPGPCTQALGGTSLYVNAIDGYCLRYPARFWVGDVYPPGIANLYGPPLDAYPLQPLAAGSALLVQDAAGDGSLSQAVDAWLERQGAGAPIHRQVGLLGGQPAEFVAYQGDWTRVRVVLALYEGKLYNLSFYPDSERFPQAAPDVNALWETVIASFAFLPPETRAALGGNEGLAQARATRTALDDMSRALGALAQFFSALQDGRYTEAVSAYGGDYQVLRDWNPTVPPNDHATLFQRGCTVNGLQCLAVKAVVDQREVSPGEYTFTVQFARELPGEPFTYTVRKVGTQYLVQELPVHVP